MKKLELKHLAAYLPYKLKIKRVLSPILNELFEVTGLDKNHVYFNYTSANYNHITPILRPFSDLTKEIEVNGEKFVPIVELLKMQFKKQYYDNLDNKYSLVDYDNEFPKAWFRYMASK